jgi:NitT/TauT family transport system ATP-binding protein
MAGKNVVSHNVSHTYRPLCVSPVLALDRISLEVRGLEFFALLGSSGCGKSTLLNALRGFFPIDSGSIVVGDVSVSRPGPDRGIVFQNFAPFPWITVRKNIVHGLKKQGMPRADRYKKTLRGLHG